MKLNTGVFTAGFAIFSMIFGSGNIVFPLIIGKEQSSNFWFGAVGWLLTTVFVPLIGYFGALLFDGSVQKYLKPLGRHLTFLILIVLMMLAGPFGITARGVNVGFGGFAIVSPGLSMFLFNLLFCAITVVLAWHPGKIVQIIGLVFTPLKFGGIAIVVLGAMLLGGKLSDVPCSTIAPADCFSNGFNVGFQTMDLLAAFLMSSSVFMFLKQSLPSTERENKRLLLRFSFQACLIAATILSAVYIGLVVIGAQYSSAMQGVPSESIFTKIAEISMGNFASWFVAVVIAVSCMATNIALTSVFTDFISSDVLKNRLNRRVILISVGIITLATSMLGFEKICTILAKILDVLYPFLILFVFARLVMYYAKGRKSETSSEDNG